MNDNLKKIRKELDVKGPSEGNYIRTSELKTHLKDIIDAILEDSEPKEAKE